MKKFISDIILFLLSAVLLTAMLTLATRFFAKKTFNLSISKNKNILVLGNSHPECAIDDSVLSNVFNLAQSGSGYFYDYLKAKKILESNPQIDTLVLGYSYGDIAQNMDSWFTDDYRIQHKIRNHFFLFDLEDYASLFKGNPKSVLMHTPQTIMHNLKAPRYGLNALGGYKRLTRNKLKEEINKIEKDTLLIEKKMSTYQTDYLLKTYRLCKENNVKLVLLSTPVHPIKIKNQKELISQYCIFAKQNMPDAVLVDDSNFELSEEYYADLAHLNYKGAKVYSEQLKKSKFLENKNNCQGSE